MHCTAGGVGAGFQRLCSSLLLPYTGGSTVRALAPPLYPPGVAHCATPSPTGGAVSLLRSQCSSPPLVRETGQPSRSSVAGLSEGSVHSGMRLLPSCRGARPGPCSAAWPDGRTPASTQTPCKQDPARCQRTMQAEPPAATHATRWPLVPPQARQYWLTADTVGSVHSGVCGISALQQGEQTRVRHQPCCTAGGTFFPLLAMLLTAGCLKKAAATPASGLQRRAPAPQAARAAHL